MSNVIPPMVSSTPPPLDEGDFMDDEDEFGEFSGVEVSSVCAVASEPASNYVPDSSICLNGSAFHKQKLFTQDDKNAGALNTLRNDEEKEDIHSRSSPKYSTAVLAVESPQSESGCINSDKPNLCEQERLSTIHGFSAQHEENNVESPDSGSSSVQPDISPCDESSLSNEEAPVQRNTSLENLSCQKNDSKHNGFVKGVDLDDSKAIINKLLENEKKIIVGAQGGSIPHSEVSCGKVLESGANICKNNSIIVSPEPLAIHQYSFGVCHTQLQTNFGGDDDLVQSEEIDLSVGITHADHQGEVESVFQESFDDKLQINENNEQINENNEQTFDQDFKHSEATQVELSKGINLSPGRCMKSDHKSIQEQSDFIDTGSQDDFTLKCDSASYDQTRQENCADMSVPLAGRDSKESLDSGEAEGKHSNSRNFVMEKPLLLSQSIKTAPLPNEADYHNSSGDANVKEMEDQTDYDGFTDIYNDESGHKCTQLNNRSLSPEYSDAEYDEDKKEEKFPHCGANADWIKVKTQSSIQSQSRSMKLADQLNEAAHSCGSMAAEMDDDFGDFTDAPSIDSSKADDVKIEEFGDFSDGPSEVKQAESDVNKSSSKESFGSFQSPSIPVTRSDMSGSAERIEQTLGVVSETTVNDISTRLSKCFPMDLTQFSNDAEDFSVETLESYMEASNDNDSAIVFWSSVRDVESTNALQYTYQKSQCEKLLLQVLKIDIKNIYNRPELPPFAVDLSSSALLTPTVSSETRPGPKDDSGPAAAEGNETDAESVGLDTVDSSSSLSLPKESWAGENEGPSAACLTSDIPPAVFDWSSSGLHDPLEVTDPDLEDLDRSEKQVSSSNPLEELLASATRATSVISSSSASSAARPAAERGSLQTMDTSSVDGQLSKEAADVLALLPDLAWIQSACLMFPVFHPSTSHESLTEK